MLMANQGVSTQTTQIFRQKSCVASEIRHKPFLSVKAATRHKLQFLTWIKTLRKTCEKVLCLVIWILFCDLTQLTFESQGNLARFYQNYFESFRSMSTEILSSMCVFKGLIFEGLLVMNLLLISDRTTRNILHYDWLLLCKKLIHARFRFLN